MAVINRRYLPTPAAWGDYAVIVEDTLFTDEVYWVLNSKGKKVNVAWATLEGAAAAAELLAEGYLKE